MYVNIFKDITISLYLSSTIQNTLHPTFMPRKKRYQHIGQYLSYKTLCQQLTDLRYEQNATSSPKILFDPVCKCGFTGTRASGNPDNNTFHCLFPRNTKFLRHKTRADVF